MVSVVLGLAGDSGHLIPFSGRINMDTDIKQTLSEEWRFYIRFSCVIHSSHW